MDVCKIIFYKVRSKHLDWSNKKITTCKRYAYREHNKHTKEDFYQEIEGV